MYENYNEERLKEDITYTINVNYKSYYCYMGPLYFFLGCFGIMTFGYMLVGTAFYLPFFLIIFSFIIFIKYFHKKEIELVNNVYYGRFAVNIKNQLSMKKKVLDIPYNNSAFKLIGADNYFTLYIANTFNDVDIRELNDGGIPPTFIYIFHNLYHYNEFILREILEDRIKHSYLYFKYEFISSEKIKYYKTNNFLSYRISNNISRYIIIIFICIGLIYGLILYFIGNNNPQEKNYYIGLIVLGLIILFIIMMIVLGISSQFYRRIDVIKQDNIIFIGITSFLRGSYTKKFILNKKSIEECYFIPNGRKKTLELKLNDNNTQKICDFKNNEKTDIISQQINNYL